MVKTENEITDKIEPEKKMVDASESPVAGDAPAEEVLSPPETLDMATGDTLTIRPDPEDKFGAEEESEAVTAPTKDDDVLSDLSLSDDELDKGDWVVLDEDNSTE